MRLALIAHDNKKHEMVSFALKRIDFFTREDVSVVATGTTGSMLKSAGLNNVDTVSSGVSGGDVQIASMVIEGKIEGVIFFIDPLSSHAHDTDINTLVRICTLYNVPLALNYKSGHILVKHFKNKKTNEN